MCRCLCFHFTVEPALSPYVYSRAMKNALFTVAVERSSQLTHVQEERSLLLTDSVGQNLEKAQQGWLPSAPCSPLAGGAGWGDPSASLPRVWAGESWS